ncbi:MAG: nucleotidyltransferase [Verrucomicrobia bacterium]|nr:nucleotidyltransferase [Verrucomicrobiota bacterium]
MKPTLLVLAAGMGSRYGGLKQIDPMGPSGETILDYSVYDAIRAGFGKVVFIIRPDFEKDFQERIVQKFADKIEVGFAFQTLDCLPADFKIPEGREKPWGTTHAILCARANVQTPFAVINADDFYGRDSYAVLSEQLKNLSNESTAYCMVGFTLKNTLSEHGTVARGVCKADAQGLLTDIDEMTKIAKTPLGGTNTAADGKVTELSGNEPVSMNMWGFTPHIFKQLEVLFDEFLATKGQELKSECYIPLSVGSLVRSGQATCLVLRTDSTWFGVTYREDKAVVQASIIEEVKRGAYPENLWA